MVAEPYTWQVFPTTVSAYYTSHVRDIGEEIIKVEKSGRINTNSKTYIIIYNSGTEINVL